MRRLAPVVASLLLALIPTAPATAGDDPCQKDGNEITFRFPVGGGRASLDVDMNGLVVVKLNGEPQNCEGATNDEIDTVLVMGSSVPGKEMLFVRTVPARRPGYIWVDLGGGKKDAVVVLGSPQQDVIYTGTWNSGNQITDLADLDGDGIADAQFDNVEKIDIRARAGNDVVTGMPSSPPKAFAVSSGASLGPARIPLILKGGKGNDRLTGGDASDTLAGGPGNDRLRGGKGKDTLIGGKGNDLCNGGPGKDTERGCQR